MSAKMFASSFEIDVDGILWDRNPSDLNYAVDVMQRRKYSNTLQVLFDPSTNSVSLFGMPFSYRVATA